MWAFSSQIPPKSERQRVFTFTHFSHNKIRVKRSFPVDLCMRWWGTGMFIQLKFVVILTCLYPYTSWLPLLFSNETSDCTASWDGNAWEGNTSFPLGSFLVSHWGWLFCLFSLLWWQHELPLVPRLIFNSQKTHTLYPAGVDSSHSYLFSPKTSVETWSTVRTALGPF